MGRRVGLRPKDIQQLVTQPRAVASLAKTVKRIEEGEVQLRVRTLEVERMLERIELRQRLAGAGLGAALALQLSRGAAGVLWQQIPLALVACKLALESWRAWSGLEKFEEQRKRFANEGEDKYDAIDVYASDV